jgi:hypothetical protein
MCGIEGRFRSADVEGAVPIEAHREIFLRRNSFKGTGAKSCAVVQVTNQINRDFFGAHRDFMGQVAGPIVGVAWHRWHQSTPQLRSDFHLQGYRNDTVARMGSYFTTSPFHSRTIDLGLAISTDQHSYNDHMRASFCPTRCTSGCCPLRLGQTFIPPTRVADRPRSLAINSVDHKNAEGFPFDVL